MDRRAVREFRQISDNDRLGAVERLPGPGPARTLGNLGRLAPGLIVSYTVLRVVSTDNSRRLNDGKDPGGLGRSRLLL